MTLSTEGTAPIPRDSHVSVIHGQSMYVFGGSTGSAMNDFHELKLDKCRWNQVCVVLCCACLNITFFLFLFVEMCVRLFVLGFVGCGGVFVECAVLMSSNQD